MNYLFSTISILILTTVAILLAGCSSGTDAMQVDKRSVYVNKFEETLNIQNRDSVAIYYFLAEENAVLEMEWEPFLVSNENKISSGQSREFRYEDIPGYTKSAERFVFYYWYESGREKNELYGFGINLNEGI